MNQQKNQRNNAIAFLQNFYVLGYRIDLYFHDYKFAIEIDENGHRDKY